MLSREDANIADSYDLWAGTYDTDSNQTRDLAGWVLRQYELNLAGRTIIEIGCGTGRNTQWLCEHAEKVLALDISDGMLRKARERVQSANVEFHQHDIQRAWPSADATVDVVIACLVLEHVEQLAPLFEESARVLRPGGRFVLCELHPMRQMLGRQAEFVHPRTGECQQVAAFLHEISDYVNGGVTAGLRLLRLDEWRDAGAAQTVPPRLLSIEFDVPAEGS